MVEIKQPSLHLRLFTASLSASVGVLTPLHQKALVSKFSHRPDNLLSVTVALQLVKAVWTWC